MHRFPRDLVIIVLGTVAGAALSAAVAAHAGSKPEPTAASTTRPPSTAAPERPDHLADHNRAIELHGQEPVDPTWAPRATEALRSDLGQISEGAELQVLDVDCRTTTCTAVLRWPSFDIARQKYPALGHVRTQLACRREITVPPPADPSAPYQATAVFDCRADRATAGPSPSTR